MFSGFIFTSNNFRKPCLKRESSSTLLTQSKTHIQAHLSQAPASLDRAAPRSKTHLQAYLQTISRREKKKKKEKKKEPNPRSWRESRADKIAHTTPDRTGLIAPSHLRDRTNHLQDCAAWSTGEIAPPEAPTRSHPWPTHAQSLSFSIYLSLSLNCRSLSSSLSLRLTEFFSSMNVLFWFLFRLSLYIEIFYYEICLETEKMVEKMWKTSRKITFSECNQTLENIF